MDRLKFQKIYKHFYRTFRNVFHVYFDIEIQFMRPTRKIHVDVILKYCCCFFFFSFVRNIVLCIAIIGSIGDLDIFMKT